MVANLDKAIAMIDKADCLPAAEFDMKTLSELESEGLIENGKTPVGSGLRYIKLTTAGRARLVHKLENIPIGSVIRASDEAAEIFPGLYTYDGLEMGFHSITPLDEIARSYSVGRFMLPPNNPTVFRVVPVIGREANNRTDGFVMVPVRVTESEGRFEAIAVCGHQGMCVTGNGTTFEGSIESLQHYYNKIVSTPPTTPPNQT